MYQVGQQVVYGIHGVCVVLEIEVKTIDRKKIPYYVLEPLEQPGARYYIPTEKPAAVAKLSPLLTPQELEQLLSGLDSAGDVWIADENQRKLRYRELINSGDRHALLAMIHALYNHKKHQAALGRKFHLCDENFLRDAEKLLSSEISLVLDIPVSDVPGYITSRLNI